MQVPVLTTCPPSVLVRLGSVVGEPGGASCGSPSLAAQPSVAIAPLRGVDVLVDLALLELRAGWCRTCGSAGAARSAPRPTACPGLSRNRTPASAAPFAGLVRSPCSRNRGGRCGTSAAPIWVPRDRGSLKPDFAEIVAGPGAPGRGEDGAALAAGTGWSPAMR